MQIFIDSANPDDILKAYETGLVDGVTTNPSLAAKAGIDYKEAVDKILSFVKGPVSLEVLSTDYEDMVDEGKMLARMGKQVVVKIPMTVDGIKATKTLKQLGIGVNMTLVFSANQALLAAKAGAEFVSPFVGRLDDNGQIGMDLITEIMEIFVNYNIKTKILVASIRHPLHVQEASMIGADVATIPPEVFWKLFEHPMTKSGIEKFMNDFQKAGIKPLVSLDQEYK